MGNVFVFITLLAVFCGGLRELMSSFFFNSLMAAGGVCKQHTSAQFSFSPYEYHTEHIHHIPLRKSW